MSTVTKTAWKWLGIGLCCFLIGIAAVACGDDNGGTGPIGNDDGECSSDADCPDGYCDDDGECVDCVDDANCDGAQVCDEGSCVDCVDDADCAGDEYCRLNLCVECREDDHCGDGERCSSGQCVPEDLCFDVNCPSGHYCDPESGLCVESDASPGYSCHEPEDLGQLQGDTSYTIEGDATDEPDTVSTECSDGTSGNAVYQFTTEGPMKVDFDLLESEHQLVMEIRQGACDDAQAVHDEFGCRGIFDVEDPQTLYAEEGVTYYVIVETQSANETGEFTIDIFTEEMECTPMGGWWCHEDDDDLRVNCFAGMEERPYSCGGSGCESDECRGDRCANALEVTAPITIDGDRRAYTNAFDFQPHPSCTTVGGGAEGPTTDFADMVVYFPELFAGQEVVLSGEDSPTLNVFGIVQDCDEENIQCLAGENQQQEMVWEVPVDGAYYGIINVSHAPTGNYDFIYSIDIRD